jgi:hypothetical protein
MTGKNNQGCINKMDIEKEQHINKHKIVTNVQQQKLLSFVKLTLHRFTA